MSNNTRRQALHAAGLAHPRPDAVTAPLFHSGQLFFFAMDKVQVKYEMLRAHFGDGDTVTAAAAAHGYSRAEFYLVAAAFERAGMTGLLDERRGRKGPVKLTEDVHTFLDSLRPLLGGRGRRGGGRPAGRGCAPANDPASPAAMSRFWPPGDPRQHAYERLRSAVLASGRLPDELAAARFARRGLAGLIVWPDAEPMFSAHLIGAARAAWTPYTDPRRAILAATYRLLLDNTGQARIGLRDHPYPDGQIASGQQR